MATLTSRIGELVDAGELLREDHRRIKALYRDYEAADEKTAARIAERVIAELKVHDALEQELFYPALRAAAGDGTIVDALAAHHLVNVTLAELARLPFGARFDAGFRLMMQNMLRHVEDEEKNLIPAAESAGVDMAGLGRDMAALKYRELGRAALEETSASGLGLGALALGVGVAALLYRFFAADER